jgi:hypothetical protein
LHGFDHVSAGLTLHVDYDRRLPTIPGANFGILQPIDYIGDIADLNRRAVAKGNHDVPVRRGGCNLIIGRNGVGLVGAVERAFGSGDVRANDRRAQIFQCNSVGCEPRKVRLDTDCGPDSALDRNSSHARYLREARRHDGVGHVAQGTQIDGLRSQRQRDDRSVRRIDLRIKRRVGQAARQGRGRGVDRRLHILSGGVDIAIEIELQRDLADAERAR